MRVVWSAEVSLLVVTLYTMRQEFASEIPSNLLYGRRCERFVFD
jgi:hypothetical protein